MEGLKGPEGFFVVGDYCSGFGLGVGGLGALGNPVADDRNLVGIERLAFAFGRHLAGDETLDDQAFFGFARDDGRTTVAAFRNQSDEAQVEAAFVLVFFAVALEAVSAEDGADVLLEAQRLGGRRR